ncbi:ribulose-phosphate 3-epimerase [Lactobacillus sp. ESL0228]|uniref:ribulose-phosphate 3-epimerase n=1 Tax=Lactobacillus sp. ESL0228 TaxID=2069352 RepID=UPI000EFD7809|nr:ribulose-phosphate 3-epimerase [Lactobacillus sp. ESL0228]RMC51582.1 ribulose-phosphate 3-epimerase [Lactobacillus sp. ESL0228]
MIKVAVSLHSGPKINIEKLLTKLLETNVDLLHIDVMDGHFVSEIDFGEKLVKEISNFSPIPLDIHMMTKNPEKLISNYAFPTTNVIGIHVESTQHIHRALTLIKELGKKCEIIVNPGTSISTIIPVLDFVDQVMVMSIDPGTSGTNFIDSSIKKVALLDKMRKKYHYHYQIEVDGSINDHNIKKLIPAGLDIAVSGSFIFNGDLKKQIEILKNI